MAKKVFIAVGHGGNDPGASKYVVEKDVVLVMAKYCRDELERHGVLVLMSRTKDENDDVYEEVRECNAFNPILAIAIHANAGGGDGFEAWFHIGGGLGKTLSLNIEAEVKKLTAEYANGGISVIARGDMTIEKIAISPEAYEEVIKGKPARFETMLFSVVNGALKKAREATQQMMIKQMQEGGFGGLFGK